MLRRRVIQLPLVALAAMLVGVGALGGVAWAAFTGTAAATQTLSSLQLGNPSGATTSRTAGTANTCTSIAISWNAAPSADAYRIQVRENGGAWSALVTTAAVTTFTDTTPRTNVTVEYRIHSRDADSGWEGATPASPAPLTCGVAPITDLVVSNPCSSTTLTWTAPAAATSYDVQRRVNGSAWSTLATDQAATSHTDPTLHPAGALVEYQVRPGAGTTDGAWSSIGSVPSWQPFRIVSITAGNSGTLGTLNAGDTVSIAFSKPVTTSSFASTSVRVDNAGGDRGFYPGSTTSTTAGPGKTAFSAFGTTANYDGAVSWSNANATWTWTSSVAGTTMSAALANETFTVGTGPKCAADGAALNGATQPTSSGRW